MEWGVFGDPTWWMTIACWAGEATGPTRPVAAARISPKLVWVRWRGRGQESLRSERFLSLSLCAGKYRNYRSTLLGVADVAAPKAAWIALGQLHGCKISLFR